MRRHHTLYRMEFVLTRFGHVSKLVNIHPSTETFQKLFWRGDGYHRITRTSHVSIQPINSHPPGSSGMSLAVFLIIGCHARKRAKDTCHFIHVPFRVMGEGERNRPAFERVTTVPTQGIRLVGILFFRIGGGSPAFRHGANVCPGIRFCFHDIDVHI